jgi:hypothetical protein
MIRGTTPVLEFELPFDTELIAEAYVTISQNQKAVFEKNFAECIHSGKLLKVNLSQEDTLKLESCCNSHAEIQVQSLTDEQALTVKDIYPVWDENGVSYQKDFYLTHNGKLYKVLQAHTSQSDWVPDAAPSLFAEVLPGQDGTGIGAWAQPGSTNPYMAGDRVTHNGKTYESLVDNNVWEPGAQGSEALWKEIETE